MAEEAPRAVALLGATNAGKSTLLNALAEEDISVVARKAQTTIRADYVPIARCLVLVDTPGFAPRAHRAREMTRALRDAVEAACVLVFVVDAARRNPAAGAGGWAAFARTPKPVLVVLNKIDRATRLQCLEKAQDWAARFAPPAEVFMVSARTGDGVADVRARLDTLVSEAKGSGVVFPSTPESTRAADITRAALLNRAHDEIPYEARIVPQRFVRRKDGSLEIAQEIRVAHHRHKAVIIGRGGAVLKAIGRAARLHMQKTLHARVHLFLDVKTLRKKRETR